MRNALLLPVIALCFAGISAKAQDNEKRNATFGFKGGTNYSNFRFKDQAAGIESKSRTGVVGGIFADLPLGKTISLEPELLYSQMGAKVKGIENSTTETDQRLTYFSLPLLLKFNLSKHFAFLIGPQFDYLTTAKSTTDDVSLSNDSKFKESDFSATAGIQLWFGRTFGIDARYIYGTQNIADQNSSSLKNWPTTYNQAFQVTANIRFGIPKPVPPPVVVPVPQVADTDGDGINDNDDKCPSVAGLAKYNGCPIPDTDGDGINDETDKCPSQAGLAKYGGCPIPDTDGDGINDEQDKCPTVAGLAKYGGCPIPDTDGDGVNDEEDKCPNRVGPADNFGCPVIGIKSYEIAFQSGKAVLLPKSKLLLDTVVTYLQTNTGVNVKIEGHTDNSGTDKINDPLSVKRAESTKAYLVSKGIDAARMTTAGYGSKNPVADNKTAAGRKKNRRIEIKIQ